LKKPYRKGRRGKSGVGKSTIPDQTERKVRGKKKERKKKKVQRVREGDKILILTEKKKSVIGKDRRGKRVLLGEVGFFNLLPRVVNKLLRSTAWLQTRGALEGRHGSGRAIVPRWHSDNSKKFMVVCR